MREKEEYEEVETRKKPTGKRSLFRRTLTVLLIAAAGFFLGQFILLSRVAGTGGLNNLKVMQKLFLLESCVDKFYLEDPDEQKMEENIYRGYMAGLEDPYAAYYTKEEYDQMMEEDSGEYVGIGVTVRKDTGTGYVVVEQVNKNGPAYEAGIQNDDVIVAIDGKDTAELSLQEAVAAIKKDADTLVKLSVFRDGVSLDVTVKKSQIQLETVEFAMKQNKIGYIAVSQFIENTDAQFDDAVTQLEEQGMKGLIIDLRDNGGGLLTTCIDMVSRILPDKKLIVYTEDKNKAKTSYYSEGEEEVKVPIVLLVNGNSASASEIMTGCLQDCGKAVVVGQQTYGKGIVQNIVRLNDGSAVKMTVAKYFTPKGKDIHGVGIKPDVVVEIDEKTWAKAREEEKQDTQLKKAMEILTKK